MNTVSVSIVVPSRGGAGRLPQLFDALRAQTASDWEAVVVLDGDIDDSEQVCRSAAKELPIEVVCFSENKGRSKALNAGLAAASGNILVRCDDDLVPGPEYVALQKVEHEQGPVGVVGLYRNIYPETPYARVYGRPHDVKFRDQAYATGSDGAWHYWAGNASISRATYELVGDYDARFRAYGYEDVDMGYRLHQAGVPIHLSRPLETTHRVAATTTAIRVKRAFYSGSARRVFEEKHGISPLASGAGIWSRSVHIVADRATLATLLARAERLDKRLPQMPGRVAEKLVAHLIEAAAVSGYGRGAELRADF